jgi:hypothetical protein
MNLIAKFPLGQIVATQGALDALPVSAIHQALDRHSFGDWGEVSEEDRMANDLAISDGSRLISVYRCQDLPFWVITEADRSATTVLLPGEY